MNKDIDQSIFEDMPVPKALAAMALPTILSQLITTVYNLADAFFIGKTNDPYKVAALSLAFVLHLFLTAIANLFGIGGGSLISRLLGKFEKESARHIRLVCMGLSCCHLCILRGYSCSWSHC